MSDSLLKLLGLHGQTSSERTRYYGVYPAIVTNITHDKPKAQIEETKGYRLKVKFPWLNEKDESFWARQGALMAGADRGAFFMPEVDDEVLVAFEHGDFRFPVIIAMLWNGKDKYPQKLTITPKNQVVDIPIKAQDGKNDFRFIHSREKHILVFVDKAKELKIVLRTQKSNEIVLDDTDGEEKIQIYDKDNDNYIEIHTVKKKITMESKTGEILIKAFATITLECKDLVTKSSKSTKMDAGTTWDQKSGQAMTIKAGATMDVKAGATMTHKAPLIKLN